MTGVLFVLALTLGWASPAAARSGAVEILRSHLNHGIGEAALDSPLVDDATNAEILIAVRRGLSQAKLERRFAEVSDLRRRLASLEKAGLLERRGDVRATFPILLADEMPQYRKLLAGAAVEVDRDITPQVRRLLALLDARGWKAWSYHFVWSQVFDSQFMWAGVTERQYAPPLSPVLSWVVQPHHPYMSGTNYYPDDDLRDPMLAVSWTPHGKDGIRRLGPKWQGIVAAALSGTPPDSEIDGLLRESGLVDAAGHVTIPVLTRGDPVYRQLQETSAVALDSIGRNLPVREVAKLVGSETGVAWAMSYHDLCWELLRRMVERGDFTRPDALGPKREAQPAPPLTGICAIVPAYAPFVEQIRRALQAAGKD